MKLALCLPFKKGYEEQLNNGFTDVELVNLNEFTNDSERLAALKSCDGLFANWLSNELRDEEWAILDKLKFVQIFSAGADHVDYNKVPSDTKLYSNVGGWAAGMAEHCLAMTFSLLRRLDQQKASMQSGTYDRTGWNLRSIKEVRTTIWGYGHIGRLCAEELWKHDAHISAIGRTKPIDNRLERTYSFDQLNEALKETDLLIIAAPANKQTRGALGAKQLSLMPSNGMIINLARAALIDRDALYNHLLQNENFTAALDVWWKEDKNWDKDPLVFMPQVLASSHNSQDTGTCWNDALDHAIANVNRLLRGEQAQGRVNIAEYRS